MSEAQPTKQEITTTISGDAAQEARSNDDRLVKPLTDLRPDEPGYKTAHQTERRDKLRAIERQIQEQWRRNGTMYQDAPPVTNDDDKKEKFFCTFPYPYMNGLLHIGHAFTITKADFSARYQRLQGRHVLFPFSFHCTGMPIQAAAYNLRRELQERRQAVEDDDCTQQQQQNDVTQAEDTAIPPRQGVGRKTKLVAKTGGSKSQWKILSMCGVPDDEIPKFVDPQYWLDYFPPRAAQHLKEFGVHVDWRRSFITTDRNPYYDSFIQWQFRRLYAQNKIDFGKRPTIYSQRDQQACMDHDRSSGEGVKPQEYTLIKLRLEPGGVQTLVKRVPTLAAEIAKSDNVPLVLVAATLRPETMYGQTNCFVSPEGTYGAYRMKSGEIFICSQHSAVNMAHQAETENMTAVWGQVDQVAEITGQQLVGLPVHAPLSVYEHVYTLPLFTISMDKGTGIVTSVPSDAPDDYAALTDVQTKPEIRAEYGITDEMVSKYKPIPILHIPGGDSKLGVDEWGDMAAVTACQAMGVKSQYDKAKLADIKKSIYTKGFYAGVMTIGSQEGKTVTDAKETVRTELLNAGLAARYWEPEEEVISRSGDKCIVAFVDQWYIKYGERSWKDAVMEHVRDKIGQEESNKDGSKKSQTDVGAAPSSKNNENTFDAFGARKQFESTLNWLGNWNCSRSFGLGTKIPWDTKFVVESLSDSTIYMAYYTVAAMLQGEDNMDGSRVGPLGIAAEDLSDKVWDYIFCKGGYPEGCKISHQTLDKLRGEFEFWYPIDLRVSGKDLVRNHLSMSLYNHAAIWPDNPELWPRSFFTNGHVNVDAQKMSKSAGNFISLKDAIHGNNVYLHTPTVNRKIANIRIEAEGTGSAIATTQQPHRLELGSVVKVSKSQNNNGSKTVISVPSETTFTFKSSGEDNSRGVVILVTEKDNEGREWRSQSWTTDTVRFALAVAGDTNNDANFASEVANSMILKLDAELNWAEETMGDSGTEMRDGPENMTLQDKLFLMRINNCIRETDQMYKQMKFSMAMKFGFADMGNHRKVYREYHEKCGLVMHRSVVRSYLETLAIIMSPVTPHWSEYIWGSILKKDGTVTRAAWPTESDLPTSLLSQDKYLRTTVESFRKQMSKKRKQSPGNPPTSAIVYIQSEFPSWKKKAIEWLDRQWDDEKGSYSDSQNVLKSAVEFQNAHEDLKDEKMFMKYVGHVMRQAESDGKSALALDLPNDELQILQESKRFIATSLGIPDESLRIAMVSDNTVEDVGGQKSAAEPGVPSFALL